MVGSCWLGRHLVSGYFMMVVLHEGPLGYVHVFLSGVVLARVFLLLVYMDAHTGEAPDADTERLTLRSDRDQMQLPFIFKFGTSIALVCYLPLFWIPVRYDSPVLAVCHNGGLLPMMCLLLLCCSLETDLLASCLGSAPAKVLGRISYCQYIIQGNVWLLMLQHLQENFWMFLPVFLVLLGIIAYVMEWLVSAAVDWMLHDPLKQPAPLVLSESTDESSSEELRSTTDLWVCGLWVGPENDPKDISTVWASVTNSDTHWNSCHYEPLNLESLRSA